VVHGQLALDQEAVVLAIEDGPIDLVAGKTADRVVAQDATFRGGAGLGRRSSSEPFSAVTDPRGKGP
jgi:hypothetical protein